MTCVPHTYYGGTGKIYLKNGAVLAKKKELG